MRASHSKPVQPCCARVEKRRANLVAEWVREREGLISVNRRAWPGFALKKGSLHLHFLIPFYAYRFMVRWLLLFWSVVIFKRRKGRGKLLLLMHPSRKEEMVLFVRIHFSFEEYGVVTHRIFYINEPDSLYIIRGCNFYNNLRNV